MSPRGAGGPGDGDRVELGDIKAKLEEIRGDVADTTDSARPYLTYAVVGGALLVVVVAFLTGRRAGRRRSTWVEVRRQ